MYPEDEQQPRCFVEHKRFTSLLVAGHCRRFRATQRYRKNLQHARRRTHASPTRFSGTRRTRQATSHKAEARRTRGASECELDGCLTRRPGAVPARSHTFVRARFRTDKVDCKGYAPRMRKCKFGRSPGSVSRDQIRPEHAELKLRTTLLPGPRQNGRPESRSTCSDIDGWALWRACHN